MKAVFGVRASGLGVRSLEFGTRVQSMGGMGFGFSARSRGECRKHRCPGVSDEGRQAKSAWIIGRDTDFPGFG